MKPVCFFTLPDFRAGNIHQVMNPFPRPKSPPADKGFGDLFQHDHEINKIHGEMEYECADIRGRNTNQPDGT
jgi:hypothetical protein